MLALYVQADWPGFAAWTGPAAHLEEFPEQDGVGPPTLNRANERLECSRLALLLLARYLLEVPPTTALEVLEVLQKERAQRLLEARSCGQRRSHTCDETGEASNFSSAATMRGAV